MAELNIEQLEVVGVEQRQEGGGIFSSNTVTVYVIDIVSSIGQVRRHTHMTRCLQCEIRVVRWAGCGPCGRRQRRAAAACVQALLRLRAAALGGSLALGARTVRNTEPSCCRRILTWALGRLCFEHGDLQHRRTLNAALISLKLPVRSDAI